MTGWQPQQYDPRQHQGRAGTPPQHDPWAASTGQRQQQDQWQPAYERPGAQPPYQPRTQYGPQAQQAWQPRGYQLQDAPPRPAASRGGVMAAIAAAAALVVGIAIGYFIGSSGKSAPSATSAGVTESQAAAQPETEAAVRSDATQFHALYAAGQWAQAWEMLAPASQKAVPQSLYVAVHQGCQSPSAGMARVIKSITMAGSTAVVTETIGGALSSLGSVTDAWTYSGDRWGITLDPSGLKDYSHGSAAADVAAMKAAGDCAT
jgi:hypothetical protein